MTFLLIAYTLLSWEILLGAALVGLYVKEVR